ncbi:MAG TPA: holo-ACP synthase [Clostridiaceae bacterium]|nr:holo-ACP synthase [Clostridiaceae bacterium]
MAILCGVDVVEVERIKRALEKDGNSFKNKVFTDKEIEYCEKKNSTKYQCYAARFAAKEAVSKAFGTGISNGLSWKDIEVINDPLGKPGVVLSGKGKELYEKLGAVSISISLSHEKEYAVACAVIETE